jgi:AraC-like DNA-binding protein
MMANTDLSTPIVDYTQALTVRRALAEQACDGFSADEIYDSQDGLRYSLSKGPLVGTSEIVRIADGVILLASDLQCQSTISRRQVVTNGDWIHIQFRITGSGTEMPDGDRSFYLEGSNCVITRQNQNTSWSRTSNAAERFKCVCLFVGLPAVSEIFGVTTSDCLPETRWISETTHCSNEFLSMPLPSQARSLVSDIDACRYVGKSRLLFMRSKALELFAILLHALKREAANRPENFLTPLTARQRSQLEHALEIISSNLDAQLSLSDIARKVGLSRTALSTGFRTAFGQPLFEYWQDLRLLEARDLLMKSDLPISEVGYRVGYSESSCFSRAYRNRFGVNPSAARFA